MLPNSLASEEHLSEDFRGREVPNQAHLAGHAELAILRTPDLARHADRGPVAEYSCVEDVQPHTLEAVRVLRGKTRLLAYAPLRTCLPASTCSCRLAGV